MVYLGSTIRNDGKFGCEIGRKIGKAAAIFRSLQSIWKHSRIKTKRKVKLFDSLVLGQLRYARASAWLLKSDLRRLDGFQVACLRQILRIPCSYISRVSNQRVREQCGMQPFSKAVRTAQLQLLGPVITNDRKKVQKEVTFHKDSLESETSAFVSRVGRPRQNWTEQLLTIMKQAAGTNEHWLRAVSSSKDWWPVELIYKAVCM